MTENQQIWADLITGKALRIPREDIYNHLPIRWWFHCFVTGGNPQWDFNEWRDYLSTWDENGLQLFIHLFFNPKPIDKTFMDRVHNILKDHDALTINGFMSFYFLRLKEYQTILIKEGVIN